MSSTQVETAVPKRKPPAAGKGRKRGTPNKATASVKAALIAAFEKLGGVPSLVKWAKDDPKEFYKLWAKLLPVDISLTTDQSTADLLAEARKRAE